MLWRVMLVLLIIGCAPKPKPEGCLYIKSSFGNNITWNGNLPIVLSIHSSYPPEYIPQLEEAIFIWETAAARKLFILNQNPVVNGYPYPKQDRVSMVYWITSWDKLEKNTNAATNSYIIGDTIVETDIFLNGRDHSFLLKYILMEV